MLFQALDEKRECVAIFQDGQLIYDLIPTDLTKTWGYSFFLKDYDVEYASLFCNGKGIEDICPEPLQEQWKSVNHNLRAIYRALSEAKISLNDNCIYDLVPHGFIKEFFEARNQITQYVFDNYEKPKNYDFLADVYKVIYDIRYQELKVNFSNVRKLLTSTRTREYARNLNRYEKYCR